MIPPYLVSHQGKNGRYTQAFLNATGVGDARPTALQIVKDEGREGTMKDKVFLLTGASGGIGLETGRALAATGARVFLGVRDLAKGRAACADFLEPGRVELLQVDVGSLASVRAAAAAFLARSPTLNVLVNNAGIMACPEHSRTADGFETQLAVNYLGHFLLFRLLQPALLAGAAAASPDFQSRVVNVSSSGHHCGGVRLDDMNLEGAGAYEPWAAYGHAKTAMIYMTSEIERRFSGQGLHGLSLMPGGIATDLQRYVPDELKANWNSADTLPFWKSTAQGAATTLTAAVGRDWEGRGGVYLEDCQEAGPTPEGGMMTTGVAPHAFDPDKEGKLWDVTLKMLDLPA